MDIGKQLRRARENLGWSQYKLGNKAGVNQSTIHRIESGQYKGTKYLLELSDALDVSVEWLTDEKNARSKNDIDKKYLLEQLDILQKRIAILESRLNSKI